jgi:hypothetical protein
MPSLPPRLPAPSLEVGLRQHPHDHRPECPVLLAIDQELGEGAALRVGPEFADPLGRSIRRPSHHAGECEYVSETDPAVLKVLVKVKPGLGDGYDWVECAACGAGWQVPHYAVA